jgi:hypothetical protein
VKCRGSFFEERVQRGLAFVEDATFPYLPSGHPLCYQWLKMAQAVPQPALTLVGVAGGSQRISMEACCRVFQRPAIPDLLSGMASKVVHPDDVRSVASKESV